MSYRITAATEPANTEAAEILQNVQNIIKTRKGTVPHYREFGLAMDWLDKPVNQARVLMVSDVRENVELYEPRVTVLAVEATVDSENPALLTPLVEVELNV